VNSKIQALRLDRTVISSLFLCVACTLLVLGLAATDATASSRHKPKRISSAKTLVLPPAARCVDRNRITLRWHRIPHVRWRRLLVRVDGRHFKAIRHMTSIVRLAGLPSGTFVLSVAAVTSRGQRVSVSRRYNDCTPHDPKPGKLGAVPPSTGFPSGRPSPAEPSPPNLPGQPSSPEAGRYTVHNAGTTDYGFSFYVSSDGVELQDVSGGLSGRCAPGGSQSFEEFYIPEIGIEPDGAFAATKTETGVHSGSPATITYEFSGHFHEGAFGGSVRQKLSYDDGVERICDSEALPWTATRDNQGDQSAVSSDPGRYTVHNDGTTDYGFSFYVSSDGVELQDVSGGLSGRCAPGGSQFYHPFYIPEISIAVDGSFDGSRSEAGLVSGQAATFTYAFSGHFHGYDSNGRARVAGVLREDLVYANGVTYSCSSNAVPWSATS
jgi:hypothetical protein